LTQYFHLDDSGDPGMDLSRKVSSHFSLAMVQLPSNEPLPGLASLRKLLHLPEMYEFKYNKTSMQQKEAFFEIVQAIPFRVRAIVVDKASLSKDFLNLDGQRFAIHWIVSLALRASELDISNDILILDGAPPAFRRNLRVEFSRRCQVTGRIRPFKKIVSGDSSREDGLQLADMVVGAITKHCLGKESSYFEVIAPKVADLWRIPGNEK
jgi:hypothetical protein